MTLDSHVAAVAAAIEDRQRPVLYVRRLSWLAPLLGPLIGDLVIETRGSWVLQRHLLTCVLKNDDKDDGPMTLRASEAVIRVAVEQVLAMRSGVRAEHLAVGAVPGNACWGRLADALRFVAERQVTVEVDDTMGGAMLKSDGVVWWLGRSSTGADIEIDVTERDGVIVLQALDGRSTPPVRRRAILVDGCLDPDPETRVLVEYIEAVLGLYDSEPESEPDEEP